MRKDTAGAGSKSTVERAAGTDSGGPGGGGDGAPGAQEVGATHRRRPGPGLPERALEAEASGDEHREGGGSAAAGTGLEFPRYRGHLGAAA